MGLPQACFVFLPRTTGQEDNLSPGQTIAASLHSYFAFLFFFFSIAVFSVLLEKTKCYSGTTFPDQGPVLCLVLAPRTGPETSLVEMGQQ